MKIWICIPVFNRVEYTLKCLESLQNQIYRNFSVVVCDHGSTDGTSEQIQSNYPDAIILQESSDLWWAGATNCCIRYILKTSLSENDVVVTLNNDLEVDDDYLVALVNSAKKYPNAIITSAGYDIYTRKLVTPGMRHSWITSKSSFVSSEQNLSSDEKSVVEVTHAPGRGTLIPICVFYDVGLYDEKHLPHYGADYDFSFRAKNYGYKIFFSNKAKVYSYVEATGLTNIHSVKGLKAFSQYLFSIKSPANLSARWWLAWNNCPKLLFPSYIILDLSFVIGGFIKQRVKTR